MKFSMRDEPAALILTRQAMPTFDRTRYAAASGLARGAYVLADAPDGRPDVLLLGTGSEVQLCVDAYEELKRDGVPARVVSMPSWELFEQQDQAYRDSVLSPGVTARVSVEEGSVISMGVFIGQSTKIYDRTTGQVLQGRVPAGSVVVSGNLPSSDGKYSLYCAVIVKRVDAQTRAKTSINELLRAD